MNGKTLCCLLIGFYIFAAAALHISSTASFRFRLADYYKCNGQYGKAIRIYDKILRKDSVKRILSESALVRANFEIGLLAAKFDFMNLAIESYARGGAGFEFPDLKRHYTGKDLSHEKLPAIGLLEAGRFEPAIKEFRKLAGLYPDFRDAGKYINAADDMQRQNIRAGRENFYFNLGDTYVENGLFKDARAFFTKRILDYGVSPMDVLRYLNKKYSRNKEIVSEIWGDNIYVVLEDFETNQPQFKRYMSNAKVKINEHFIMKDFAYEGNRSEFLDMTYSKEGYDYWSKEVIIPINAPDLNLGLRLFVKGDNLSGRQLLFWVVYKKQGLTGICNPPFTRLDAGNGWTEWRINNLSESARAIASRNNWNSDGMMMEKIIIDMQGCSGKFYIDEIQLILGK
ncbi:MAG: hypothetical protein Q8N91_05560 [Candidatus Omnitrophota bacterium]|nr:hypothetical protein [Candidatus Omnitrophota bacterium]